MCETIVAFVSRGHHLLELVAVVEALFGRLVKRREISDVWRVLEKVGISLLHIVDEHTELGAPVPNMVMSQNLIITTRKMAV